MAPNAGIILTALFQKLAKEKEEARYLENYIHIPHTRSIHIQSIKKNRKENLERNPANLSSGR